MNRFLSILLPTIMSVLWPTFANASKKIDHNAFTGCKLNNEKIRRNELVLLMRKNDTIYPFYKNARNWKIIANTTAITSFACVMIGYSLSRDSDLDLASYVGMLGFGGIIASLPIWIISVVKYKKVAKSYNKTLDLRSIGVGFRNESLSILYSIRL